MFTLFEFSIFNFLDILAVTILLFSTYKFIRGTIAINIFFSLVGGFFLWRLVQFLEMDMLSLILGTFYKVGFLALIIIFQQEIRHFFMVMGSNSILVQVTNFFKKKSPEKQLSHIDEIISAIKKLAQDKIGALIVIKEENNISDLIQKGDEMNADVNSALLESIFYPNSPLHDGAVIIEKNKITSTRSILPVSYRKDIPARLGLRHRAAIGITEKTDAVAIVVSEELGTVSFIKNGRQKIVTNPDELKILLT